MKHRLELFSDAVMAIVITIMVLDLHTPATGGWHAFVPILPAIGIYSIGFSMIGLCWLTHHRYFAKMETFNRKMVWSNFFFLFVVSLLPLLVRNVADHPGDAADTEALILWNFFTVVSVTLFRFSSYRDNIDRPGFREWFKSANRRALFFIYPMLLAQAGLACVWPRVGLGMFVIYTLWVVSWPQ
jgi:uncharacterized membrane protein